MPNQYTKTHLKCSYCNKLYEKGFFGSGSKYCSKKCSEDSRKKYYREKYIPTSSDCEICHRDILKVGERKQANKYCSNRCMQLAQGIREGQKTDIIKLTIDEYRQYVAL